MRNQEAEFLFLIMIFLLLGVNLYTLLALFSIFFKIASKTFLMRSRKITTREMRTTMMRTSSIVPRASFPLIKSRLFFLHCSKHVKSSASSAYCDSLNFWKSIVYLLKKDTAELPFGFAVLHRYLCSLIAFVFLHRLYSYTVYYEAKRRLLFDKSLFAVITVWFFSCLYRNACDFRRNRMK